ncbi:uncharacterized protein [Drosophila kikkawai]|uniref:Uncharacterized protein n=1 Tax=Drosophila kikkawai TaxID=30033 RepID=A0A6P4JFH8_DROKI|nr:uncharacterized protein LOC108082641 [Drosophila kikkawai]
MVKGSDYAQLQFLNKFIDIIHNERVFETIIMLWHHEDENCTLQHWNPQGVSFLRSNELGEIRVRATFNKRAVAIVCLTGNSYYDAQLLEVVAGAFETMRQERILLWTQNKLSKKYIKWISIQAEKHKFIRMLVLEIGDLPSIVPSYRLEAFPTPHFTRIKNISRFEKIKFYNRKYNFQGKTIFVKPSTDEEGNVATSLYPITRLEDMEVIEFAQKYNGSLKVLDGSNSNDEACDIQFSPQIITLGNVSTQMDFVNPLAAASLLVIVPCSSELSLEDVLRRLEVLTWMWYLLCVYGSFVCVETLILVVTHRLTGESRPLTLWNPLMNLRAFRAILGLPFPELRRASLSLRQLFLAITLFGFIFSNFFSCKLSALLTSPIKRAQVQNFEELRDSGIITVTNDYVRSYIENEIDPEFFRRVIPKFIAIGHLERVKLFSSLNKSYSFILLSTNWQYYDQFQRVVGHKFYCKSQDLIITENLPWVYVMPNNSVYNWPLSRFLISVHESGISTHWMKSIIKRLVKAFKVKLPQAKTEATPIRLQNLNWLWHLLVLGYVMATLVFIIEILITKKRNRRRRNGNGSQV